MRLLQASVALSIIGMIASVIAIVLSILPGNNISTDESFKEIIHDQISDQSYYDELLAKSVEHTEFEVGDTRIAVFESDNYSAETKEVILQFRVPSTMEFITKDSSYEPLVVGLSSDYTPHELSSVEDSYEIEDYRIVLILTDRKISAVH